MVFSIRNCSDLLLDAFEILDICFERYGTLSRTITVFEGRAGNNLIRNNLPTMPQPYLHYTQEIKIFFADSDM